MKLTFLGAAHEVTGSCHYIEACGKSILLDCGMEQGRDTYENQNIPVSEKNIDYIFLSHAHIDHSGLIPSLYKNGFRGEIYCTEETFKLCGIMLKDSAQIQDFETKWKNRKAVRAGESKAEPIYTTEDVQGALKLFRTCSYNKKAKVCEGVEIRFRDAGHMLGSAEIEIWISEYGVSKKIVFSGDIGNKGRPIINDPEYIKEADYIIMESTYGDRLHEKNRCGTDFLAGVIQKTFDRGGNLIIPAFAVGRTQELLYYIREIKDKSAVKGHEGFRVYIDSPLAAEAIKVFNESVYSCFDKEAAKLAEEGVDPISFPGLKLAVTAEESRAINNIEGSKIIISASGMCEGGRIRHHLKHNLWRTECTVLLTGYQAAGSLGRILADGAEKVELFNEKIKVNAEIVSFAGISGHADRNGLISWAKFFGNKVERVFVVHGSDMACEEFSSALKEELGLDVYCPYSGAEFDLKENKVIKDGLKVLAANKNCKDKELEIAVNRLIETAKCSENGLVMNMDKLKEYMGSFQNR